MRPREEGVPVRLSRPTPVTDDRGNVIGEVTEVKQQPDGSLEVTMEVGESERADLFRGWQFHPGDVSVASGPASRAEEGDAPEQFVPHTVRVHGVHTLVYRIPTTPTGWGTYAPIRPDQIMSLTASDIAEGEAQATCPRRKGKGYKGHTIDWEQGDPYMICSACGYIEDARTGAVIRAGS